MESRLQASCKSDIRIIKKEDIAPKRKAEHEPYEYIKYNITKQNALSQCQVSVYEIPPLKSNYPYHYHTANTEVFYIVSGIGILRTPEGEQIVNSGDFIVCPPTKDSAHKLTNKSETEVLCYIDFDTVNSPDIIHYLDSGKTGIIMKGEESVFYKEMDQKDYYDGE